ncbi:zinc finger CCHC domain-containing protein 8 homolog isoform X2 [Bombus huntii]|uniref:zinc finger CCHC domain-containing protein 8 homolog isoform X2 n=1 Tax=Bombus huntii TaxID=85661 RepID=UPI0021AA53CC|nr:zinc finger CCHC domain-containing protein 8 homolog isoform X2 [Bombus huntii]
MNSTITINDTDEEVIDLDSSQDINITDNDQSECSIEKDSLPNNNADKMNVTNNYMDNNKNASTMETCDSESSSTPLLKVMFRDENIAWQYSKRIKVFLEELVSSKIKCQENDNGLTLEVWDNDTDSTSQSIDITTGSDDSQDIICDTLFTVDKQPRPGDEFDVPSYSRKYILCDNVFDDTKLKSSKYPEGNSQRFMCFNCSGNHNLRDCTEPRNYTAIEANRKNFNMKGNSKGLRSNELPRHIYRMRKLGYPPGWLEEARLQHSGLSLFNSDGIAEEDPNDEPGHIVEERDRDQYDIKKIYDFPGFNVPAPPGTWDEDGKYSVSTMLTFHSKQRMLSNLKGRMADDGYKRKKLKVFSNTSKDSPVPEPTEMEIEDVEDSPVECVPTNGLFIPPLPLDDPVKPPEPLLPQESCAKPSEPLLSKSTTISEDSDYHSQELQFSEALEDTTSPTLRANSPSLSELENMKKQLLVELQKSNSDISSKSNSSNSVSKSDMPPPSNEITPELNRIRQNGINTSHGSVKSIDFGTPVLQSTSPYNKLPPSEKFSKNICNLINFENLPDSTGKYEQMTGVLQKVRHTLAKLHQE